MILYSTKEKPTMAKKSTSKKTSGKKTTTKKAPAKANTIESGLTIRRKRDGERKVGAGKQDSVTEELSKCENLDQMRDLASNFGITKKEMEHRVDAAPNFGQLRMVVGNRIRGVLSRMDREKWDLETAAGIWDDEAKKVRIRRPKKDKADSSSKKTSSKKTSSKKKASKK